MFQNFMTFMEPYWTTLAVFFVVNWVLDYFNELIGIRGIWKWLTALVIALLFFHFWDDVSLKFETFLRFMGLQPVEPGTYKVD